jgi:hypothetical protein
MSREMRLPMPNTLHLLMFLQIDGVFLAELGVKSQHHQNRGVISRAHIFQPKICGHLQHPHSSYVILSSRDRLFHQLFYFIGRMSSFTLFAVRTKEYREIL